MEGCFTGRVEQERGFIGRVERERGFDERMGTKAGLWRHANKRERTVLSFCGIWCLLNNAVLAVKNMLTRDSSPIPKRC